MRSFLLVEEHVVRRSYRSDTTNNSSETSRSHRLDGCLLQSCTCIKGSEQLLSKISICDTCVGCGQPSMIGDRTSNALKIHNILHSASMLPTTI